MKKLELLKTAIEKLEIKVLLITPPESFDVDGSLTLKNGYNISASSDGYMVLKQDHDDFIMIGMPDTKKELLTLLVEHKTDIEKI